MARIMVTDDSGKNVLWNEHIHRVHLQDEHSGNQVLERLAWAVEDAETHSPGMVAYRQHEPRRRLASA